MTALEFGLLVGFFALGIVWVGLGVRALVFGTALFGFFGSFAVLWGGSQADRFRVGITGEQVWFTTAMLFALVALAGCLISGVPRLPWRFYLTWVGFFSAYLLMAYSLSWAHSSEIRSGVVHVVFAAVSGLLGVSVASMAAAAPHSADALAGWLLLVVLLQTSVASLQFLGVNVFVSTSTIIEDLGLAGRASGTLGHPSTVGKAMFLLAALAVSLLSWTSRRGRTRVLMALATMIVPITLSGGRANLAGYLIVIVLLVLTLEGRHRWGWRLLALYSLGMAAMVSAGTWGDRFRAGENGFYREKFLAGAMRYLREGSPDLLFGAGPNSYVTSVGPFDSWAAQGWIVHNTYVLSLIELGVFGACIVLGPFLLAALIGLRRFLLRPEGTPGLPDVGLVALGLGTVPIYWTGWGMLSTMLAPSYFVLGMCFAFASVVPRHQHGGALSNSADGVRLRRV